MSDEQDSWLEKLGVKIVRAASDVAEGDLDAAAGAGTKVVSVAAGAAAGVASGLGRGDTAKELQGAQAAAQSDSDRYFRDASRNFGDAGAQFGSQPPGGFPLPPPTERPDPPPSGGPPTERNPPPTERPDPPPSGGPPTERGLAPTQAVGLPAADSSGDIDLDRVADVAQTAAITEEVVVGQALANRANIAPNGEVTTQSVVNAASQLTPLGAVAGVLDAVTSSVDTGVQIATGLQDLKDGNLTKDAPLEDKAAAAQQPIAEQADGTDDN